MASSSSHSLLARGPAAATRKVPVPAAGTRRSQAERRSHDERVTRVLDCHFQDFPKAVQENNLINGVSLRMAVAKILFPDESVGVHHVSSQQIACLRLEYATGDIAESILRETERDQHEPLNKLLSVACESATAKQCNKRDRKPLIALLPTLRTLSGRELKMVLRCFMSVRPSAHPDICACVILVMRFLSSRGLDKRYPRFCMCVRHVWDDALTFMYNLGQKAMQSLHAFHDSHRDIIGLATSKAPLIQTLLETKASSQFREHLVAVREITDDSNLGAAMFGWALTKAVVGHMEWFIEQRCSYASGRPFTAEDMQNIISECVVEGERAGAQALPSTMCLASLYVFVSSR